MIIGIPKEIKDNENRVGAIPAGVQSGQTSGGRPPEQSWHVAVVTGSRGSAPPGRPRLAFGEELPSSIQLLCA